MSILGRYGLRPKKANDPLRLGKRKRKCTILATLLIGASVCTLYQERAQAAPGQQTLSSYTEVKKRDSFGYWRHDIIQICTVIFLVGGTTWIVPGDWNNSNNSIECIGGGGNGAGFALCPNTGGGGGGGGAYANKLNQSASGTVPITIGGVAGNTSWNSGVVLAAGGASAVAGGACNAGGAGGTTAASTGTTKFAGGHGGSSSGLAGGGGGGGAAGLHAAGNNGAPAVACPPSPGAGGQGDGTFGGAGGPVATSGSAGTEWNASHGSGGGGGGANNCQTPGAGGLYGAGGGGTSNLSGGGAGKQGIIIITYVPSSPTNFIPLSQVMVFM